MFAVTVQLTAPLPVALAGVQVSQLVALLDAVQPQPAPAVTLTEPVVAAEPGLADVAEIEYVHAAPACDTVNVWPAIVREPMRELVLVLAATENAVVPLPVPLAPPVIVIQVALLIAVQLQPLLAATLELPLPPPKGNEALAGEME